MRPCANESAGCGRRPCPVLRGRAMCAHPFASGCAPVKGSTNGMARQSAYTYEELLACGRGELFGQGNAQLPLPPMLMFDRIASIGEDGGAHGKGHVVAELDVRPDLWFFPCHFKG